MVGRGRPKKPTSSNGGANLGFEAKMWLAADELRGQVDAAEYKHVVLGLVFLKYISDAFEEHHSHLLKTYADEAEDRDSYRAEGDALRRGQFMPEMCERPQEEMAEVQLRPHSTNPRWNYEILPRRIRQGTLASGPNQST